MCEKDFGGDFDLLEDAELLDMLRTGILNDVPTYSTPEVTATQILNINTQELVPRASSRKHNILLSIPSRATLQTQPVANSFRTYNGGGQSPSYGNTFANLQLSELGSSSRKNSYNQTDIVPQSSPAAKALSAYIDQQPGIPHSGYTHRSSINAEVKANTTGFVESQRTLPSYKAGPNFTGIRQPPMRFSLNPSPMKKSNINDARNSAFATKAGNISYPNAGASSSKPQSQVIHQINTTTNEDTIHSSSLYQRSIGSSHEFADSLESKNTTGNMFHGQPYEARHISHEDGCNRSKCFDQSSYQNVQNCNRFEPGASLKNQMQLNQCSMIPAYNDIEQPRAHYTTINTDSLNYQTNGTMYADNHRNEYEFQNNTEPQTVDINGGPHREDNFENKFSNTSNQYYMQNVQNHKHHQGNRENNGAAISFSRFQSNSPVPPFVQAAAYDQVVDLDKYKYAHNSRASTSDAGSTNTLPFAVQNFEEANTDTRLNQGQGTIQSPAQFYVKDDRSDQMVRYPVDARAGQNYQLIGQPVGTSTPIRFPRQKLTRPEQVKSPKVSPKQNTTVRSLSPSTYETALSHGSEFSSPRHQSPKQEMFNSEIMQTTRHSSMALDADRPVGTDATEYGGPFGSSEITANYGLIGQPVARSTPLCSPKEGRTRKGARNKKLDDSLAEIMGIKGPGAGEKAKSVVYRPVDTLTGYEPIITSNVITSMAKSKPSKRLVGEIAFQLDRRILEFIFDGTEKLPYKKKQSRYYGFSLGNIMQMIDKEANRDGVQDKNIKQRLCNRLSTILRKLYPFGYNLDMHADFTQDMVNKYGLLNGVPDNSTIEGFGMNEPGIVRIVLGKLLLNEPERNSMLIILDCLCFLAHVDGESLFMW